MVQPAILTAHHEIRCARKCVRHIYNSDFHPDWVVDCYDPEHDIRALNINLEVLPSALEEALREAFIDMAVSENIAAEMEHHDMQETYRAIERSLY